MQQMSMFQELGIQVISKPSKPAPIAHLFQAPTPEPEHVPVENGFGVEIVGRSPSKRKEANKKALELIDQGRIFDSSDRLAIMSYSGLGGIGESKDQYYTPSNVARFAWAVISKCGVTEGDILEPSCGAGVFIHTQPDGYKVTGVELDFSAAKVARALWAQAEIINKSFEAFAVESADSGKKFSAVIGNVPFGVRGASISEDKAYLRARTHEHYFLQRSRDLLLPNGVIALICHKSVMDNDSHKDLRQSLANKMAFIGAFRFGSDTFKDSGAAPVTDLILLRNGDWACSDDERFELLSQFVDGKYFKGLGKGQIFGDQNKVDRWGGETVTGKATDEALEKALARFNVLPVTPTAQHEPVKKAEVITPNSEMFQAGMAAGGIVSLLAVGYTDQREKALTKVQEFISKYGSPEKLKPFASKYKAIAHLIAAVNTDGTLADMFRPKVITPIKVDPKSYALEQIRSNLDGVITFKAMAETVVTTEDWMWSDPEMAYLGDGQWTTMGRYVSGEIYPKIDEMESAIRSLSTPQVHREKFKIQLQALMDAKRHTPLEEARISLRDGWIPTYVKNDFINFLENSRMENNRDYIGIEWSDKHSAYFMQKNSKGFISWKAEILEKYLNHQGLGGRDLEKQKRISDMQDLEADFKEWVLASYHAKDLQDRYDRAFNGYIAPTYSEAPIVIPKFTFKLHGYQYQTIRKMIDHGRGIIALDVGLGKTLTSIALALKLKAEGRVSKCMIVVPKSVLSNWKAEIEKSTKGVDILYIGEKFKRDGKSVSMSPSEREIALKKVMQNDYDLILITDSAFQSVPLSPEVLEKYAKDNFYNEIWGKHLTDYKKAKARDTHESRTALRAFLNVSNQTFFDDLGIDCLLADEGHFAKNMSGSKQNGRIRYLPTGDGAKRSYDFNSKARFILENNNSRGVYLITATPTKNTPLEAYTMIGHIAPEEWTRRGIMNIEHFIDQYGLIETRTILGTDGNYTDAQCLVGFSNLNNLRGILFAYTDMRDAKEVGLALPDPSPQIIFTDMDEMQLEDYKDLRARALSSVEEEGESNHIFAIMNDMENISLDPYLYDPYKYGPDYISPKMKGVCQAVHASLQDGHGGQIIFTSDKFVKSHEKIKKCLVQMGIKESEIGIINGITAPKSSDRHRIGKLFNEGKLKVVIGNDGIIGQGVNLQEDTSGIQHASLPWTPADITQRNGRGLRQGNQRDQVSICTHFSKGSFDAMRHEALMRKANWIGDLWRGKAESYVNMEADTKGGIDPGELQILLSPDPEAARLKWEGNKELAMKAFHDKKRVDAYEAYLRMDKLRSFCRYSGGGERQAQVDKFRIKIQEIKDMLLKNEYFTHHDILEVAPGQYEKVKGVLISKDLNRVFVQYDYVKMSYVRRDKTKGIKYAMIRDIDQRAQTIQLQDLGRGAPHVGYRMNLAQICTANLEPFTPTDKQRNDICGADFVY